MALLTLFAAIATGEQEASTPSPGPGLEAQLDEYFQQRMDDWFVPGAVCVVVKDGKVLMMKGYGVENLTSRTPVDPQSSVFYIASVGKLFTAIAVLKAAEMYGLNFDADVNDYLTSVQVEQSYPMPMTLHHLLTHTAGLDERTIGYTASGPDAIDTLAGHLAGHLPPRIRPPGVVVSYSNYGFGLAGLVVSDVASEPFTDFVQQKLLAPLGMNHSVSGALPGKASDHIVQGYWSSGDPAQLPYSHVVPAGGIFTTGSDMKLLLLALLGDQAGQVVITPWMRSQLLTQQFTHDPRLPGYGFAVYERWLEGTTGWEIGGAVPGAAASVYLLPESHLGIFVALDRQEPDFALDVAPIVLKALGLTKKWQSTRSSATSAEKVSVKALTGLYRSTRYSRTTLEKLTSLFQSFPVTRESEGQLRMTMPGRDGPSVSHWARVSDVLFRETTRPAYISFGDRDGTTYLYTSESLHAPWAFEKVPFLETPDVVASVIATTCLLFLLMALASLFRFMRGPGWIGILTGVICVLNLAFVAGLLVVLGDTYALTSGPTPLLLGTLTLPILSIAAWLTLVWQLVGHRSNWHVARAASTLALATLVVSIPFYVILIEYNLLGFLI